MANLSITIDFLQQQLDETKFTYTINKNGVPLTYDSGATSVDKTFRGATSQSANHIKKTTLNNINVSSFNIGTGFNGSVYDVKLQSTGKAIVVGLFSAYNGTTVSNIVRLNTNGTIDTTFTPPAFVGVIRTIAVQSDDKIIVGGDFTSPSRKIARLSENGQLDSTYVSGSVEGMNNSINRIMIDNLGRAVVVGMFTEVSGLTRNRIVRMLTNGDVDTTFDTSSAFNNINDIPNAIAFKSDGKIVVGGDITSYKTITSVKGIVQLTVSGAYDSTLVQGSGFAGGTLYNVRDLVIDGSNRIYCTGNFTSYNGTSISRICRLTSTGTLDNTFAVGAGLLSGGGYSMKLISTGIIVGGTFTSYKGTTVKNIVRIDSDGSINSSFNTNAGYAGGIRTICVAGLDIIVGGDFTYFTGGSETPTQEQLTVPIGADSNSTKTNTYDNLILFNSHSDITYTIVGTSIIVNYTYEDGEYIFVDGISDVPNYVTVTIGDIPLNAQKIILSRSEYSITYTGDASSFDYVTGKLYIWKGSDEQPSEITYPLTAYKTKSTDNFVYLDISEYVKSELEPTFNESWFASPSSFNETCWVKWTLTSYKVVNGFGVPYETQNSDLRIGTLGYELAGLPSEFYPPQTVLINPADKYSTLTTQNYLTSINVSATQSNELILREQIPTNYDICSYEHREWQVVYLNKYGVFDSMLFNRVSKRTLNVKNDKYQFYTSRPDIYNATTATSRVLSSNGTDEWVVNTDLLDENQNKYMEEIFLSDRWFLINSNTQQIIPVILTDKKFDEKLGLYERAKIQWTLKFESANSKIKNR